MKEYKNILYRKEMKLEICILPLCKIKLNRKKINRHNFSHSLPFSLRSLIKTSNTNISIFSYSLVLWTITKMTALKGFIWKKDNNACQFDNNAGTCNNQCLFDDLVKVCLDQ